MSKRFVLAAGGTGGHIYPAISLAEYMISQGDEVLILCDDRTVKMAEEEKVPFVILPLFRPSKKIKFWISIIKSCFASRRHIMHYKPDAIIGFGGYPSFPTLLVAFLLRIPIFIHEQNVIMGRVNYFFSRF